MYHNSCTYIIFPSCSLQHCCEEPCWKGEPREPEEHWGMGGRGPRGELLHSLDEVPGPRSQRLEGGERFAPLRGNLGIVDAIEDLLKVRGHHDQPLDAFLQLHQGRPDCFQ